MHLAKNIERLGTETAFEVLARASALEREGQEIINLGIGQPDFKTPGHIVEAAVKALRDGHHGYTPANGILELREAVASDLFSRHNVEVDPDCIVIVPGGKVTMFFAIMMFGEPNTEIMYPDPGFPIYKSVIDYTGATAVPIHLKEKNNFAFNADEVLTNITPATRLIIINSPANPTGGTTPKEEMDKLVKGLREHPSIIVMSDEIYSHMLYEGRQHISLLQYEEMQDRTIMLDGWSKTYAMSGWRLGFAVWPKSMAEIATRLAINCHSCVNAPTQHAGIAALKGPHDEVQGMIKSFNARRKIIIPALNTIPGFKCIDPGGAFYAFPNITGTGLNARELQDKLLTESGVATVAGTSFGDFGEGYIRFSYANSIENIELAIERIKLSLSVITAND